MEPLTLLNDLATILSLILGGAGFVLGVCNYLRDKAKVEVHLMWGMKRSDRDEFYGVISVVNTGRRPVCVGGAVMRIPGKDTILLENAVGQVAVQTTLSEGSPSALFFMPHDGMEQYKDHWQEITAEVSDTSGKVWKSKKVQDKPSWAE